MARRYALMLVLSFAVISTESKPAQHRGNHEYQKHCSKVRGKLCRLDIECACVNRHNTTLICNSEGRCGAPNRTKQNPRRTIQSHLCSNIRGKFCDEDSECACVNPDNTTLVCNYMRRCETLSRWDKLMRKNGIPRTPCPGVFKAYCKVNADCTCSEHPLICEDHECVREKTHQTLQTL